MLLWKSWSGLTSSVDTRYINTTVLYLTNSYLKLLSNTVNSRDLSKCWQLFITETFDLFESYYLFCPSYRGWFLSRGHRGHVSSTQIWWRAPSCWCSSDHRELWWPGCHWTQTPGHCHVHYLWADQQSSWQSCLVQEGAPQCQRWPLKNKM